MSSSSSATLPPPLSTNSPSAPSGALGFMARPTPQLRATIAQQQAVLTDADFVGLLEGIRSVFDKYTARLGQYPRGTERAAALHHLMDRELKAAEGQPISCREGCGGCCHYEVEITQ